MHKTLERQLKHHITDPSALPADVKELLDAVSKTYEDYDKNRELSERSLEISSNELREIVSLLQATLDATDNAILVVNTEGKMVSHNKKFVEMWGIPHEIMETHDDAKALEFVLDKLVDPEAFMKKIKELYASPEAESHDTLYLKDGRVIERHSRPQVIGSESVGRVWSFGDVTNEKKAEQAVKEQINELERLNKIMVGRELKMVELKEGIRQLQEGSVQEKENHDISTQQK